MPQYQTSHFSFLYFFNFNRYVSTLTHCQTIVTKEGILGGPGQTDKYAERIGGTASFLTSPDCQPIPPPAAIGTTMETMFQKGVVFAESKRKKLQQQKSKSVVLRGWSLSDFWEHTSWPRDSETTSRRFGLPVVDIADVEDEPMIAEAPDRRVGKKYVAQAAAEPEDDLPVPPKPKQDNPFVHNVVGIQGMQTEIIDEELDCIMFLSAKFCKTCKQINPIYTRMARLAKDASPNIAFVKTEASGKWGKELGRELEVDAVPSFVLFRNGERYGTPLSVSRLPSRKIDRALELLESGADWDPSVLKLES
jgi:thiol-disulfide isomerase/thioredoxin